MSYNGYESPELRSIFLEGVEECENSSSDSRENSSVENSPLRGFQKLPVVVINRLRLDKLFENSDKLDINPDKILEKQTKLKNSDITKICSVKLVRENLEQLKIAVKININANKRIQDVWPSTLLCCKICEKAHTTEKLLQQHLENKHLIICKPGTRKPPKRVSFSDQVIIHELKNDYRCRKCILVFNSYKLLKTHLKRKHKKRKYICHYCTTKFDNRNLFKVHIKLHCDECGLLLPNKAKYQQHRQMSCRNVKKYKCNTCLNSFFRYMDLKEHSYDHFEKLFICDICKEQLSSKCAISHHISFLHSNKRPRSLYTHRNIGNKKLYLCNFCNETSKERQTIQKHVSNFSNLSNVAQTGYNDYFYCDQCLMRFKTEAQMLKHKWTHFLPTSDNSCLENKYLSPPQEGIIITFDTQNKNRVFSQPNPQFNEPRVQEKDPETSDSEAQNKNLENTLDNSIPSSNLKIRNSVNETPHVDIKSVYNVNGKLPSFMQPRLVLKKLDLNERNSIKEEEIDQSIGKFKTEELSVCDNLTTEQTVLNLNNLNLGVKKAIVDPVSKKTIISRYQCEKCNKYYSSNYCLNRHIVNVHLGYRNLRCNQCEETFLWPSLLQSHRCIRSNSQMYNDAGEEVQFDNGNFDNETMSDDVDFEIPAPIVELIEYDECVNTNEIQHDINEHNYSVQGYKIVVQEVPIEF